MSETCQKLAFTHPNVVLKCRLKNNWMKKLDRVNRPYYHQIGFESKYFTPDKFNNATKELHSKFSVFHLNVGSLNKHHNELLLFLSVLHFFSMD